MAQLTKRAFAAWLDAKAPDAIVGKAGSSCGCPLANFLTERERPPEGAYIEVDGETWDLVSRRKLVSHPLPRWAAAFVDAVDDSGRYSGITAAEARHLLATARYAREVYEVYEVYPAIP